MMMRFPFSIQMPCLSSTCLHFIVSVWVSSSCIFCLHLMDNIETKWTGNNSLSVWKCKMVSGFWIHFQQIDKTKIIEIKSAIILYISSEKCNFKSLLNEYFWKLEREKIQSRIICDLFLNVALNFMHLPFLKS